MMLITRRSRPASTGVVLRSSRPGTGHTPVSARSVATLTTVRGAPVGSASRLPTGIKRPLTDHDSPLYTSTAAVRHRRRLGSDGDWTEYTSTAGDACCCE